MRQASLAVDRMTYPALLRRLRTELYTLEQQYPPAVKGGPLEATYKRMRAIARELELRGLQGRLDV